MNHFRRNTNFKSGQVDWITESCHLCNALYEPYAGMLAKKAFTSAAVYEDIKQLVQLLYPILQSLPY